MGATEAKIIAQAKKMNMPLPDKIANRPVLGMGLQLYYRAFTDLHTDRGLGMGEGPIRWTAINSYGYRHGYVEDEFDRLVDIVQAMDRAYRRETDKSHKKSMAKTGKKSGLSTTGGRVRGPGRPK